MTRPIFVLLGLLLALTFISLTHGDHPVTLREVAGALFFPEQATPQASLVVLDLRLPRALLALLVGCALAVAGALAQALLRNPLAEPGLLGINAGAALAAMFVIVVLDAASVRLLPLVGFAGAGAMAALVYALSWRNGTSSLRILLIGIGAGAVANAGTTLLISMGEVRDVQRAIIWLAGGVHHADWAGVQMLGLWLVIPLALIMLMTRDLDLISLGDQAAQSLGQRIHATRGLLIMLSTALCGAAVAAAGPIGFVGLIAPHMARRLVGPGHARLIPTTALIGAGLVSAADLIGRTVLSPLQLPAGLVTALIGAPFFGFLLWRRRYVPA